MEPLPIIFWVATGLLATRALVEVGWLAAAVAGGVDRLARKAREAVVRPEPPPPTINLDLLPAPQPPPTTHLIETLSSAEVDAVFEPAWEGGRPLGPERDLF